MAVGMHTQYATTTLDGATGSALRLDASFEGNGLWHPWPVAQVYGLFNFNAANPYLWARVGATHQAYPLRLGAPVALRAGAEATSSGTFQSRVLELGPVVELAVRDLGAVVSARAGVALAQYGAPGGPEPSLSLGIGMYWAP
jgi:hypothetical protein